MTRHVVRVCALLSASLLAGCEIGVEGTPEPTQQPAASTGTAKQGARVARGHLRFVEHYADGYSQAVNQGKPMLVFFTAAWCHFCHQMAEEAFTHPQVVSLSEHFVCILVDADAEPDVCRQFDVTGYPTIQFLSPRGAALDRIVGKKPGHQLMMAMQAALQSVARRQSDADDAQGRKDNWTR
jgi:protein disulfide-isomerase